MSSLHVTVTLPMSLEQKLYNEFMEWADEHLFGAISSTHTEETIREWAMAHGIRVKEFGSSMVGSITVVFDMPLCPSCCQRGPIRADDYICDLCRESL